MAVTGPLLEKWHWLGSYPGNHTRIVNAPKVSAGAAVCSDTHGLKKDNNSRFMVGPRLLCGVWSLEGVAVELADIWRLIRPKFPRDICTYSSLAICILVPQQW